MLDSFTATHLEYVSARPFDEVVSAFEGSTGDISDGGFEREVAASKDVGDFERRIRGYEADSGFMRFLVVDHGAWSALYGAKAKSRLYILGNPLIAHTMLKHDAGVGLNVPVRLLIYEASSGEVRLAYDQPSSLMSRLGNENITAAAETLDAKLAALAERVTGAKA